MEIGFSALVPIERYGEDNLHTAVNMLYATRTALTT